MAAKLKFEEPPPVGTPGVVPHKAAIMLGDLRAKKAVPALAARLHQKARGDEHRSALIALGYIATPPAVDAILGALKDAKADPAERASAADALYLSGDRRAVPTLLEIAKTGYVMTGGQKASDLRASAAIALARIAGKETYEPFKALDREGDRGAGRVRQALDRMQVANECDQRPRLLRQEAERPALGRAPRRRRSRSRSRATPRRASRCCSRAMKPITTMVPERYPVHQAILFALARLGTKDCKECIEKLDKQIERDEKAVRLPGARDLLGETRVTEAIIQNKGASDAAPPTPRRRGGRRGRARRPPPRAARARRKPAKPAKAKGGKKKRK